MLNCEKTSAFHQEFHQPERKGQDQTISVVDFLTVYNVLPQFCQLDSLQRRGVDFRLMLLSYLNPSIYSTVGPF
jgi:hypothetical protein